MASLSSAVGLGRGGENVGGVDAPADMLTTIGMARRSELTLLMWLPPHTPDDPGNLTAQLPLLAALRVAAAVPATLCGSAQPAPAVLFAPSLGAFLSLGEAALEFISTNVSAPPGLRGEVMWSAGPFSGGAVVALDVNASSGALQLRRADGSVAWQCMGPSSEAVAVDGAGGSFGSASLFLTVTDGPGLRLYAGTTESPGHFVDVTTC